MDIKVKVTGPMFRGDPARVLSKAIDQVIIAVSKVGVTEVKSQLAPGHGVNARPGPVAQPRGTFKRRITYRKRGKEAMVTSRNWLLDNWLNDGSDRVMRKGNFRGYKIFDTATVQTEAKAGSEARAITSELVRQLGGR